MTTGVLAQGANSPWAACLRPAALEIAKGDYKASAIIGRVGPVGNSVDVIKDISEMEGRQIFNLIKSEQPQTIAFVLSYLDSAKSSEVFGLFGPEMREEIIERLGTIESTSLELVGKIAHSLGKHFDTKVRPVLPPQRGRPRRGRPPQPARQGREQDPPRAPGGAERDARRGGPQEDLQLRGPRRLQPADLQRVLREVDSSNLAISMKSASEALREKIYGPSPSAPPRASRRSSSCSGRSA
jgi:flagellar motor switch protein FliG